MTSEQLHLGAHIMSLVFSPLAFKLQLDGASQILLSPFLYLRRPPAPSPASLMHGLSALI